MSELDNYLQLTVEAAIEAGKETLNFYETKLEVDYKSDLSPLTQADIESNRIINNCLEPTGIPILSEENTNAPYSIRKEWKKLWIVDPLDGTKEFINNRKEYTINIALVIEGKPVLGVIYTPVLDVLFFGVKDIGAYKLEGAKQFLNDINIIKEKAIRLPLFSFSNSGSIIVLASLNHRNNETNEFIKTIQSQSEHVLIESYGSSLKLCRIAEGSAHIYPRMAPTMEWDIAAGHAIVEAAGCKIKKYPGFDSVCYNKENLLNPSFIVYTPDSESFVH
jgi:3'(2'), 5'-bisphosphate nucleotidase